MIVILAIAFGKQEYYGKKHPNYLPNAYGVEIEYEQLKINLFKALALLLNLEKDIELFLEKIN
jgi:hypothetical protein